MHSIYRRFDSFKFYDRPMRNTEQRLATSAEFPSTRSRVGRRMLRGLYLNFIHNLLDVGNAFGKRFSLDFLLIGLDCSAEYKGAVLCLVVDALLVKVLMSLDGRLEVALDRAIKIGRDGVCLTLFADGANPDFVGDGVVRSGLLCEGFRLGLQVVGRQVAGKGDNALVSILRMVSDQDVRADCGSRC